MKRMVARIGILLLLAVGACTNTPPETLTPVQTLAIRLHSLGYVRTLDEFRYTLTYQAVPPDKIIINVGTPTEMTSSHLERVAESARGAVKKMAEEQFGIKNLNVDIVRHMLSDDERERIKKLDAKSQVTPQ